MGVLTNIVVAEDDEIEAIGESLSPIDEWTGIELRNVDTAKIATLHSLLTGDLFDDALSLCEPVYVSASEGALVLRLADELMERLAALGADGADDDALDAVAAELAATEEFESAGWEDDAIAAMLAELTELARLADAHGQAMFVWLHPLRT
jgi:hypothetical protein